MAAKANAFRARFNMRETYTPDSWQAPVRGFPR